MVFRFVGEENITRNYIELHTHLLLRLPSRQLAEGRAKVKAVHVHHFFEKSSCDSLQCSPAHSFLLHDFSFSALRLKIVSCTETALSSGSNSNAFSIRSTARTVSPTRMSAMELQ